MKWSWGKHITKDQRRARYHELREAGWNPAWSRRMRDWPPRPYRRALKGAPCRN